jgi:hypothetical protein
MTFYRYGTWNEINERFHRHTSHICSLVTSKALGIWMLPSYTHPASFPVIDLLVSALTLSSWSLSVTLLLGIHLFINLQRYYMYISSRFWCFSSHRTWNDWRSQDVLRTSISRLHCAVMQPTRASAQAMGSSAVNMVSDGIDTNV